MIFFAVKKGVVKLSQGFGRRIPGLKKSSRPTKVGLILGLPERLKNFAAEWRPGFDIFNIAVEKSGV